MKLVTYQKSKTQRLGIFYNEFIYDIQTTAKKLKLDLPSTMKEFLEGEKKSLKLANKVFDAVKNKKVKTRIKLSDVKLLAPVPNPPSMRDGYAFRQHVQTARRNRGVEMIPEFDQYPVFYFANHNAVYGEGTIKVEDDHLDKLDFELECAIVIGKKGKNIPAAKADSYIAGYTIMNDWSARTLQMEEMKLNLGPAKGKDFATSIGPWLVTVDELETYKIKTQFGNKYDLKMIARHNGKQVSKGNLKDMNWTFAELIERASYGVTLYPGDVIGSGTVGTGCYLELNGTQALQAKEKGESFTPIWIKEGDQFELEITGLGILKNKINKSKTNRSILMTKKNV